MVKKNSNGYRYAQIFLKRIRNLELKKDYRTNHGEEFTGGMEDKYGDKFKTDMGCCTTVLMDERLKSSVKRGYYG